ncbi:MAG TPA: penicillin-binding protein 2 [Solirubrobacterales bacterium]|nr:penicillin-binding protein 2 [Solirubrobacterales bacterium]
MFNQRERPLVPAQFALRVAILSGFALVMFSLVFFRLWYLQVLSGDKYLKQAQNNQVREITVQAPRGEITDRSGNVLVDNRTALALQIQPTQLPRSHKKQKQEFQRLSQVAGMSAGEIEKQIRKQTKDLPANPVTLERDVGYDLVYYLRENQGQYPGVTVQRVYVRHYPDGTLGAQIFGYVREVTGPQLKEPRYQGLQPGDQVGQSGVENTYDNVLRGTNGMTRVQVDAEGRPTGGVLSQTQAKAGDNLLLTIDKPVQEAGEAAIGSFSTPGAFVAMNVRDGEILGLGSSPTFDPSIFTKPVIPPATFKALTSQTTGAPLADRAVQGLYPTGSTFKPITAMAALESGVLTPTTTIVDGGSFTEGGITLHNAGGGAYGALQLPQALQVSSDVFFYNVGADLYLHGGDAQQKWASELGIGHPTGIDLPGEVAGLLPTPAWRNQLYKEHQTDRPWSEGDSVNLAIGQGDLQTNPLQMAVAYAAIANGGDVVRPHVGMEVDDPQGRAVQEINPAPERHLDVNPQYRSAILEGIHMAAQSPGGTSYPVFGSFPIPMAGKTGTAQRLGQNDQSWYVALAPYPNPQIVVAATIEQGGFGVQAAAPVARQVLEAYFNTHKQAAKAAGGKIPSQTSIQQATAAAASGNPY